MILADKIIEERKKNGWSQEELADKLSVSRQSVSKWESAQSTPDLQRVIRMAELFQVSTDYLLRDDLEAEIVPAESLPQQETLRMLSMEEANDYLDIKKKASVMISGGVSLCIISPALLVFLAGFSEAGYFPEGVAVGIGMTAMLAMIAAAVFTFIAYGVRESRYEFLEKDVFETAYGVSGLVNEKKRDYEGTYGMGIGVGVALCILAALPLIVAGAMNAPDVVLCGLAALLLVMVAAGVNRIVTVAIVNGSYSTLLQEGEYSVSEKRARKKMDLFHTIYWCSVTAVYLGWSFWTMRWDFTWIIWPVAAVFSAAAEAIARMITKE